MSNFKVGKVYKAANELYVEIRSIADNGDMVGRIVNIDISTEVTFDKTGCMTTEYGSRPEYRLNKEVEYEMKSVRVNTISLSKKYTTRDGRSVELISIDTRASRPVLGIIDNSGVVAQWDAVGYWDGSAFISAADLIEVKEEEHKMNEISVDKKYTTRDGRSVDIIAIRKDLKFPVIGIIDNSDAVVQWDLYGIRAWCGVESPADLIEVNPYADFKIDDKVLVSCTKDMWLTRHFAGISTRVDSDKFPVLVYPNGTTSYTNSATLFDKWKYCVRWEDRTDDMVITE